MELRSLTTCIVRMFTSHYLNKPLNTISDIDINNFLCSINRFGTRADVARQVLSILFGRITKDYDVLLGIVVGWLTLTRINNFQAVLENYKLPDYNILIKDWKITRNHSTFMPHESVLKEIQMIVYYTCYKWCQSKRGLEEGCGPNVLQIWPNQRLKRRIIPGDESQPMDMVLNTQPLKQVPQKPSTEIPEASQSVKEETLRIFDPTLGREVENINNRGGKKFQNVSQLQFNKLARESNLVRSKTRQHYNAQEINKTVRQILNDISPDKITLLTERFNTLSIDNIELLETTVNLVFEKGIEKQGFAPLCSSLCSAMQTVQVLHNDKAQEMDFAKKLTACKDLEKKQKLQVEYEKYKRTSHERSVRNCRFMGELFKKNIFTPTIIMYRIEKLITKRVEEPLECLCILLKTVGKELEQMFNLNDIFYQLNTLKSKNIKSKIPLKIVFMIEDLINVRKNKWNFNRIDSYMILISKIQDIVANEQQPMALAKNIPEEGDHHHNNNKISPIEPVEPPKDKAVLLNSIVHNKINMQCKKILLDYEQLQNLDDIIYSLSKNESSVIHTKYEEFVKSMSLITLDNPISRATVAGKIFAELLTKKILPMTAINQGIDDVLSYWNDFLMDYPQFFSYIAAIIAPLLLSQNASFDFNNLKDSCKSIRPDNSSKLLTEVLYQINSSKETQNIKEELCGILWIYNKWNTLENVTLDVFMPNNQINKYFKKDRIGVFLLSIAIYDKIKLIDDIKIWICTNISAEIIKSPLFVRALTIAIVILCLKLNYSYEDFFDATHLMLLTYYINLLPEHEEIQAREVQCMFGIQIMSAALNHPKGMVLKILNNLYQYRVISKESFELFIEEYEKIKYEK
eukprot:XP_008185608.2 PREDICTED: LOW QUALITY PROTEIN: uncharacterized protein LOC103310131 [Acyrthosiphon pisum]